MVQALLNFRANTNDEEFKTILAMTADDLMINKQYSNKELSNDDFLNQLNICKEVYKRVKSRDYAEQELMITIADEARKLRCDYGIDAIQAIEKAKEIYHKQLEEEKRGITNGESLLCSNTSQCAI